MKATNHPDISFGIQTLFFSLIRNIEPPQPRIEFGTPVRPNE